MPSSRCTFAVALFLLASPVWSESGVAPSALPDPFRPALPAIPAAGEASESAGVNLKPQMILSLDGERWARVAGKMVREGERIAEYQLHAIEPTRLIWRTPAGEERVEPLVAIPLLPQEATNGRTAP